MKEKLISKAAKGTVAGQINKSLQSEKVNVRSNAQSTFASIDLR